MAFANAAISDVIATTIQSRTGQHRRQRYLEQRPVVPPQATWQHQDVLRR